MEYTLRKAGSGEAETVFELVKARIRWMDEKGIRQWNVTDYLSFYPLTYFQDMLPQLYVLCEDGTGRITAAAVLKEQDDRWGDDAAPAYYVHNLVAAVGVPGAGAAFLRAAEQLAAENGKKYLRLDAADDNPVMTAWYEKQGFLPTGGTCTQGDYHGLLRQKPCGA